MRLPLRRALLLTLTATMVGTSACFGSFNLTRKLYGFNKTVSNDKFVRELVFLGLNVVPIYSIAGFIDAVVANTVEFWTGENPISMSSRVRLDSATTVQRVTFETNGVRTMTLKAFQFDTLVAATTMQYAPGADHATVRTVFSDGRKVTTVVDRDANGDAFVASSNDAEGRARP